MNLAYIPSPPQGVWYLAGIPIRAYALCIVAGILVAVWLTKRRYVARGGNADVVMDAALVAVPAGIVGGRLYHVITDNDQYFCDSCNPIDALKITNGGLGIWGAVALGVLMVWVMMKVKGLPIAPLADAAAPGIILAQAIGRLGNYFNQELYGAETTVPWGLKIFYRVNENGALAPLTGHSTGEVIAIVHPTFLYEMIWNVLVCVLLLWADKKFNLDRGRVFWLYVAGYTLGRFWIELMRTDHATLIYGLRVNTITSTVLFIISVACVMWLSKNRTKDNPSREAQIL
ncbi:prolipoprotein diacylglyceryl transferase [Corynebacterium hindlerae]|uniref:prolipoprotein diacylglyceryl transferase n=1 Tax=Corynebacterium hindlerae TaxID=699041 RepID=UPI0031B6FEB8